MSKDELGQHANDKVLKQQNKRNLKNDFLRLESRYTKMRDTKNKK